MPLWAALGHCSLAILKPQKAINDFPPKLLYVLLLMMMHNRTEISKSWIFAKSCWKMWTAPALVFQLKIISFLNFPKGDNILDNSVETWWNWKVIYDIWIEILKGVKTPWKNSANCCWLHALLFSATSQNILHIFHVKVGNIFRN